MASSQKKKAHTALDEKDEKGSFVRTTSGYTWEISADGPFKPAKGRYHLYIAKACPWASRCYAALKLKGLANAIPVFVVHPTWARTKPSDAEDLHCGWQFAKPDDPPKQSSTGYGQISCSGCIPDTVNNFSFIRDIYEQGLPSPCCGTL